LKRKSLLLKIIIINIIIINIYIEKAEEEALSERQSPAERK